MIYLQSTDRLLFQGDSITHGGRGKAEWDQNHIIGHGYQDTVAQTLGLDNIDRRPTILNRGVSGDTLVDILARKQEDLLDLHPTMLSILVGVNDAWKAAEGGAQHLPDAYERDYRALLDEVIAAQPGIRLILGQPFQYVHPTQPDTEDAKLSRELVKEHAVRVERIAKDYGAVFVRYGEVFDQYLRQYPAEQLIWDGVHPTYVGHAIMAKTWLAAVEKAFGAPERSDA